MGYCGDVIALITLKSGQVAATKFGVTKHQHTYPVQCFKTRAVQLLRFKTLFAHAIFVFGNTDFDVYRHYKSVSLQQLRCFVTLITVSGSVSLHNISVSLHLQQGTLVFRYTMTVFGCMFFSIYTGVSLHYLSVSLPLKSAHVVAATRFSVTKH